jgi:hypothetical protein
VSQVGSLLAVPSPIPLPERVLVRAHTNFPPGPIRLEKTAQIPLFLRAATPPPPFDDENQSPPEEEEQSTTIPSTSPTPTPKQRYAASKAAQLLSAFYWRRHFSLLDQEEQEPEPEPEPERGAGVREGQEEEAEEEEEGAGCSGNGSKRRRRRRRPVDVVAVSPGSFTGFVLSFFLSFRALRSHPHTHIPPPLLSLVLVLSIYPRLPCLLISSPLVVVVAVLSGRFRPRYEPLARFHLVREVVDAPCRVLVPVRRLG